MKKTKSNLMWSRGLTCDAAAPDFLSSKEMSIVKRCPLYKLVLVSLLLRSKSNFQVQRIKVQ